MLRNQYTIKSGLYSLPSDPLATEILIPAFREATKIHGAFGWFTAGWIRRLAPGLADYLSRTDVDSLRFTIAPEVFEPEFNAMTEAIARREYVVKRVSEVFNEASSPSMDALANHAVECLAWMVASGRLELTIAQPRPGANYHPKLWLFSDGTDEVAVRGSANATGRGLEGSVEHYDVDTTWDGLIDRVHKARSMYRSWTAGEDSQIEAVFPLPDALKEEIVRLAPSSQPDAVDPGAFAETAKNHSGFSIPAELNWTSGEFSHQAEAVHEWERAGRKGILAMATGSGKTVAALIAACRTHTAIAGPLLVVISVPSIPLVLQWMEETRSFGIHPIAPTLENSRANRQKTIGEAFQRLRFSAQDDPVEVMVVTNRFLVSDGFQHAVSSELASNKGLHAMHIADEAHTLGAESFVEQPTDFFQFRLGLSATPERQYDDEGTSELFRYFGSTVFEFGLDRAIGFCLVPYDYHVHVALLEEDELEAFSELSRRIGVLMAQLEEPKARADQALTALIMRRRAIVETAEGKYHVLWRILTEQGRRISHTLVYTSSKNPEQLERSIRVVAQLEIAAKRVTQHESGNPAALETILDAFDEGDLEVLVAKRVLDEGVDLPSIRQAILMSSSTVEREWIQRRGRLLRKHPGKSHAVIHDVIALPPPPSRGLRYDDSVQSLIANELERVRAFGRHARNPVEVLDKVTEIHNRYFG